MVWIHKHSQTPAVIEDFVNSLRPRIDGIQGSISFGTDIHVWVRQGDVGGSSYELKASAPWGPGSAQDLEALLAGGRVKILSFNMSSPANTWYFEEVSESTQNWIHKSSQSKTVIQDFVNSLRPRIDGIQGSLSFGTDFHVWVREGDADGGRYELKASAPWGAGTPKEFESSLAGGRIKILSFNMSSPANTWYFEQMG